jgi:ABC-type nitrate/sulfonate/bicarbonate transport system permease component
VKKAAQFAPPLLALALMAALWEAAVRWFDTPPYILPGPLAVIETTVDRWPMLLGHGLTTLAEIGLGLAVSIAAGVGLGVLIHGSRFLERTLMPLVVASQAVPVFAAAPLLIVWFGYGLTSKVVMTAVITFFPLVINTVAGLRAADPDVVDLLRILDATPRQIFFKVRVMYALPYFFSGLKIAAAVSVIGAVIGEWVGAQRGLGFLMIQANAQLKVVLVFAAILTLSVMGVTLYGLAAWLERRFSPRGAGR